MPEPRTITEAAGFIRRGDLTPSDLLEQCLARIDRYEPRVRAWAYLDRDRAREEAARLTGELKSGQNRGPLHGIPVGIKDIIDVFDMPTGCGSKLWANSYARRDATCVARLRQAGAVIVGKTVTTAYASFDPPPTRNPWDLDRTPGGSSSGSAAAVACGMCLGALATQTGGSITRPASYCGVCSIKPTWGRVSVDGVLPLAPSLDHVGVMANCVRDVAEIAEVLLVGTDGGPRTEQPAADLDHLPIRYVLNALPGFADGLLEEVMRAAFEALPARLSAVDWRWHTAPLPPGFGTVRSNQHSLMGVEAAAFHEARLRRHPDDYPPNVTRLLRHGIELSAAAYDRLRDHFTAYRDGVDAAHPGAFCPYITPATTGPPPPVDTTGDPAMNSPWSYSGLPVVSLPFAWTADGLPLAVQLTGRRDRDMTLLRVAARLEADLGFEPRPLPV